ncbi:MAG: type II toxin-antitoxin system RelE/ParE family toxin [Mesorhizobium amorphae]|nr:MAG: type II toxin-antitoxin system RelE/ParE family toxin [Mesorhizobium amorphae]
MGDEPRSAKPVTRPVFTDGARDDLSEIASYVAEASGSARTALRFVDQLIEKCVELASLPGTMGRARPEIAAGIRSTAFGNHVIFFRYADEGLVIVGVLEGHRDIGRVMEGRD